MAFSKEVEEAIAAELTSVAKLVKLRCKSRNISVALSCRKRQLDELYIHRCAGKSGLCRQDMLRRFQLHSRWEENIAAKAMLMTSSLLTKVVKVDRNNLKTLLQTPTTGATAVQPAPGFFALVALLVAAVVSAVVLIVLAVKRGFWVEKKTFLAVLAMLVVVASVGAAYWIVISTGYSYVTAAPGLPLLPLKTVEILSRVSSLMFLLLLSLFTWVLLSAVMATVFPGREKLSLIVAVVLAVMALGIAAYSIAVAVLHSTLQATLIVDVTGPLIAGFSFLLCAALTAMWAVAWRVVETKYKGTAGLGEMRRNAAVFCAGSALLAACALSWFVVALLELTVNYDAYHDAARGLEVASLVLTVLAVLLYAGAAVIAAGGLGKSDKTVDHAAGYVPLTEDSAVPAHYANV